MDRGFRQGACVLAEQRTMWTASKLQEKSGYMVSWHFLQVPGTEALCRKAMLHLPLLSAQVSLSQMLHASCGLLGEPGHCDLQ